MSKATTSLLACLVAMFLVWVVSQLFATDPIDSQWVVGIHLGSHDNTMVISRGSVIYLVLELERIFGIRYFEKSHQKPQFVEEWTKAIAVATAEVNKLLPKSDRRSSWKFHTGILVQTYAKHIQPWMFPTLKKIVHAGEWKTIRHEKSHALHGLYDSSFQTAVVVTSDTDEHDGLFNIWYGTRATGIHLLGTAPVNIALGFEFIGASMSEMNGGKREPRCWNDHPLHCNKYAGTLMGYSSLGTPSEEWKEKLRPLFSSKTTAEAKRMMSELAETIPSDEPTQRVVAASAQALLEELYIAEISKWKSQLKQAQGIVIAGDMGLNVKANSAIQRHFNIPVWVPEAPSDDGVPIGAIWAVFPPSSIPTHPTFHQELMYLGLPIQDLSQLESYALQYGATKVTPKDVAQVLVQEKTIGILRGRQEVGPRALLHRSLIAIPTSEASKQKMNKIKARQWFRPVAPSMNEEVAGKFFVDRWVNSPYMSFAPKLQPWVRTKYPAVYHYDGSARPQTLSEAQNAWAHELLSAVAEVIGDPIVINTSFNTKGRPILNSVEGALEMLRQFPELDYVLAEDYLFSREAVLAASNGGGGGGGTGSSGNSGNVLTSTSVALPSAEK